MSENNENKKSKTRSFKNHAGNEFLSTLIFMIVATVIMIVSAKILG